MATWRQRWQNLSAVGCGLGLLTALAVAWLVSLPVGVAFSGARGVIAAGIAALICWIGTASALVVTQVLRSQMPAAYAMLVGMGVRMVLPLVIGLSLQDSHTELAAAGFLYYLIAFYQLALVLETLWFVAQLEPNSAAKITNGGNHV